MSFIVGSRTGLQVTGLKESISALDNIIRQIPQTKRIHHQAAEFFVSDAKSNAHVISGRTRGSIRIARVDDRDTVIEAGFGMPGEERREGTKPGTPHATMSAAAQKTATQFPNTIKLRLMTFSLGIELGPT